MLEVRVPFVPQLITFLKCACRNIEDDFVILRFLGPGDGNGTLFCQLDDFK